MERQIVNRFRELLAIKSRREGRNISQHEVARKSGVPRTTINNYARNEIQRFDAPTIRALCEYFDCKVGDLLVIEDVEAPELESPLVAIAS